MNHLEIEYKTMLNKAEFNRMETLFSHIPAITQTNYYFDTDDFIMRKKRLSLRIRTFDKGAELTLKIPKEVGTLEHNIDLSRQEARQIIESCQFPDNAIKDLIHEHGVDCDQLKNLGHLTTVRREKESPIGLMALDKNNYAGRIDYELELEVEEPDKGKVDFEAFLLENNIDLKYAKSKVARFCSTLKQNDRFFK
ncbi:CYTH domain-containing protein [Streptococcus tangpeifui]|uniref:CYTH domain-containing protein n=1 Tax=Streptococcus tangpeifui TaxID=2709400 RepID=UPI0013EB019A|nr:CYTH domain-containing protein [Streptococcus sp. ZJ1593]